MTRKEQSGSFIRVKNLVHEFFRRNEEGDVESINRAVDEITLEIEKGEFIGILGSNGSGKSTFARHLNALLFPTEGNVWVAGYDTDMEENILPVRKRAGMVFQNPDSQLVSNVVEEDVGFGPENLGVPTEEIWKRVDRALSQVSMQKYRRMSPNRLSGGQKQRVAIAGVLAMKPECIILDEATAMLDPVGRREVVDAVRQLNQVEKITVIHITHYMEEIENADKVFVLSKGKLVSQGTPEALFAQPEEKLREWGLELPQTVQLANALRKRGLQIPEDIIKSEQLVDFLDTAMRG